MPNKKFPDRCGAIQAETFVRTCMETDLRNESPERITAFSRTYQHIISCGGCFTAYAHELHEHRSNKEVEFPEDRYRRNLRHLSSQQSKA